MLKRVLIHNSPAFADVELYVKNGFNVFSGASGSGKSVFMASLLAILGIKEGNADLIEANIDTSSLCVDWDELGIPYEDGEIVLSILKKDKTRYFINHSSSSKKRLFDIVSGFAKHISTKGTDELQPKALLRLFDSFIANIESKHQKALIDFKSSFDALHNAQKELTNLESQIEQVEQLKAFARFEVEKIMSLNPKEGQYEELLALKKALSKQEKIRESIINVKEALTNTSHFETFLQLIDASCPALTEGLNELESLIRAKEEQLETLEEVNEEQLLDRLSGLSELIRRFGSITEAIKHCETQRENLQKYEHLSFDKQQLEKHIDSLMSNTQEQANALHSMRLRYLESFSKTINGLCKELKLPQCHITLSSATLHAQGNSVLNIALGSSDIANISSGEYNRLRLAIMCIDAEIEKKSGILILDEVDANLSGEESEGVAKILKKLSKHYQVFAISHQTHMPSLADTHYLVEKQGDKSIIRELDKNGRIAEIARIISGSAISKEAITFAKKQLEKS